MKRVYPIQPLIGVGAIVIHDNKILLVKRGHEPCKGCWSVPGGVQRVGETLEQAVLRELYEETGIKGAVEGILWIDEVIILVDNKKPKYHYVIIDFLIKPHNLEVTPGGDAVEAKWFPIDTDWSKLRTTLTMRKLLSYIREHGIKPLPYTKAIIVSEK